MLLLIFALVSQVASKSLHDTMLYHRSQKKLMNHTALNIPMIVMPFVKRKVNYLDAALTSVAKSRKKMPVILVNGSPHFKVDWCNRFDCFDAPSVPDEIFKHVIQNDKRGDDVNFLKWRTRESFHAMFAFKQFLKSGRQFMIFLQDDVLVHDLDNIPDNDITCLRTGKDYCGLVAYKLKRWVVVEFLKRLQKHFKDKPIDWIFDELRTDLNITFHRLGKVDHKGRKSSNNRLRRVDY